MFGKTTKDKECNYVRLANEFIAMGNFEAAAKMLCATKSAKEAGLTIEDCRLTVKPVPIAQVVAPAPQVVAPSVVVPVTINPVLPVLHEEITVYAPKPVSPATTRKAVKRHMRPTCQNNMELRCVIKTPGGEKKITPAAPAQ
jgi:hypothetical protein